MKIKTINLGKDFSPFPGLRYRDTVPHSGEEFRDELFIPALKEGGGVRVELDDINYVLATGFLDEVFGGAVRRGYRLTEKELQIVTDDVFVEKEIWDYIKKASAEAAGGAATASAASR